MIRLDHILACELANFGRRRQTRLLATPRPIDVQARVPIRARRQIGTENSLAPDQAVDQPLDWFWPEYLELRDPGGAGVPSCQDQTREIHEVIVVKMREEGMRHVGRALSGLEQTMMAARSMIEHDHVTPDLHD